MTEAVKGRVMALDIGDRWLGVAVSDPLQIIASPHSVVECQGEEDTITQVVGLAKENGITLIVAGYPRSMDGTTGQQARKIERLVEKIASLIDIPVILQDERLSTDHARQILTGKPVRNSDRDDAIAAAIILQDYLNAIRPPYPDTRRSLPHHCQRTRYRHAAEGHAEPACCQGIVDTAPRS